jgi:hypothetical protein
MNHTKSLLSAPSAVVTTAFVLLAFTGQAQAQTTPLASVLPDAPISAPWATKMRITMRDGEVREIYGTSYRAKGQTEALAVLSSEFATLAVIGGSLAVDELVAKPGQALVTPISRRRTERFAYDAARLSATLRPEWVATARPALNAIASNQKRAQFWGFLETTDVNATSPAPVYIEDVRQSYLAHPAIVQLRRRAGGSASLLSSLTAQKFVDAIKDKDAETLAAVIDPYPFTDASNDTEVWQRARHGFATRLLDDTVMASALRTGTLENSYQQNAYFVRPPSGTGSFIIHVVARDGAAFIASVEPLS